MTVFVIDAGAQIAIDRNDRGVSAMHLVVLDDGDEVQAIGEAAGRLSEAYGSAVPAPTAGRPPWTPRAGAIR